MMNHRRVLSWMRVFLCLSVNQHSRNQINDAGTQPLPQRIKKLNPNALVKDLLTTNAIIFLYFFFSEEVETSVYIPSDNSPYFNSINLPLGYFIVELHRFTWAFMFTLQSLKITSIFYVAWVPSFVKLLSILLQAERSYKKITLDQS